MNFKQREQQTREIAQLRKTVQAAAIDAQAWQCCLNCLWWSKQTTIDVLGNQSDTSNCGKFKGVPPPHIVISGCVEHDFDIPF